MNTTARREPGHRVYQKFAAPFSRLFSSKLNPLYHLGDISVFLFTVACISGIYIFLFYNVDPKSAYTSVENISANPFNGWMRSIHRYSSDLLVVFILAHFIHSLITGKFKRIVSWISGVSSFLVVLFIGITGFILVWDQKGKLAGYLTAKLFSAIPIFDSSIAGAFLLNDLEYIGGFFRVSLFGHIFFSVATVILLWVHVMRLSKPKLFPPRSLMVYTFAGVGLVSIIFPVISDAPAQNSFLPASTTFDWFYYFGFYLMKVFSVQWNWIFLLGSGTLLAFVPYFKRKKTPPAVVDLEKCDGCKICSYDCPYGAIDMLIRGDKLKAILNPSKCVSCGICIASCKEEAITMEGYPLINTEPATTKKDLAIFSCQFHHEFTIPQSLSVSHYQMPCIGSVAPRDVQKILENDANGALLLGCEDCFFRYGKKWTIDRFSRNRTPLFSKKAEASRVKLVTMNAFNDTIIQNFADELKTNHKENKFQYSEFFKTRHAAILLIMLAASLLVIPFSRTSVSFFDLKEKKLIVNFKYISSPIETTRLSSEGSHMQSNTALVSKRSPVEMKITSSTTGKVLLQKEYLPRGLRQDIAIFIYAELNVKDEKLNIELRETALDQKILKLDNMVMNTNDGTFVILEKGELKKATL